MFEFAMQGSFAGSAILATGFVLGLKHAMEADHLAAVSTIVSERKSIFSSALVGGLWGLGHTISLLIAGVAVILLDFQIGARLENFLEFMVGLMLVALGINALKKLRASNGIHFHSHSHGGLLHAHPHLDVDSQDAGQTASHHGLRLSPRPVFIGMIHGLAGSAALMLLVIPTIHTRWVALLYIALFGVGSIGGMMLMSALVGLPVWFGSNRSLRLSMLMRGLAGAFSLILGLMIVYERGLAGRLAG